MATPTSYTVKAGDSLSLIARNVLGDTTKWPEIARLNALAAPYTIRVGQVLKLPTSATTAAADTRPVDTLSTRQASSRLRELNAKILTLASQMIVAKQRGDEATLATLRISYKALSAEAAILRQQINRSEAPAELLIQLDAFSDKVLDVGRQIGQLPGKALDLFKYLPAIIGGLAVLGVLAFLWAYRKR